MKRGWRQFLLGSFLGLFAVLAMHGSAAAAEFIMFERSGCAWCMRWDLEVAPGYERSEEGRIAPLRRVSLDNGQPRDLPLAAPVRFTPTFVLMDRGRELGRITGYMDEATFWGLLGKMIERLGNTPGRATVGAASHGRP